MNEKLQYASMLEMPFSTANVTVKPTKKRKKKVNPDAVKQELIEKVNAEETVNNYTESITLPEYPQVDAQEQSLVAEENLSASVDVVQPSVKNKRKFKFSVIGVQFAVIGALIATIFLTNALNPNSGISAFFKGAFTEQTTEVVDERLHSEFAPVIALNEGEYDIQDGIMTLTTSGSIYSPCDGEITSIEIDGNGKYTVEIEHSKNFKSRLSGLDYVYGENGATVFSNIPVGYMGAEGATLCFTGADGSVISNYEVVDNSVVWLV